MRIGILTFHRALNYGAVLQCFALQKLLTDWGHDVWVIDYRQPYIEAKRMAFTFKQLFAMEGINAKIDYIKKRKKRKIQINKAKKAFDDFILNELRTTHKCDNNDIPQDFDAYIIGSDQLWSENCLGGKFDYVYLAKFKHNINAKTIGYAISINRQSLDNICKWHIDIVNNFSHLSLREDFAAKEISRLSQSNVGLTIDPTLLLDSSFWDNLTNDNFKEKKYVFLYQVRGNRDILYQKAKLLAEKLDCQLIGTKGNKISVQDFISAIKYARCVITSSFHATAFSIIFHKPFYAFKLNDGKDARYVEMMDKLGLKNYHVDTDFQPLNLPPTLPENLNDRLKQFRKPSLDFLKNALG